MWARRNFSCICVSLRATDSLSVSFLNAFHASCKAQYTVDVKEVFVKGTLGCFLLWGFLGL